MPLSEIAAFCLTEGLLVRLETLVTSMGLYPGLTVADAYEHSPTVKLIVNEMATSDRRGIIAQPNT